MQRKPEEILVDRLLTLFLTAETQKSGWLITGKVKLLKLIYLSEAKMLEEKAKGFSHTFYKWEHGPMSNTALSDYGYLIKNGLLETSDSRIVVTTKGREVLKMTDEIFAQNKEILNYILKTINEFGPYPGKRIKHVVYGRQKMGEKMLISEVQRGEELLHKLNAEDVRKIFLIDEEWLETLSILMDKQCEQSLERGLNDAKEGKIARYVPMQRKP